MARGLSRQEASNAVTDLGWRFVLGTLGTVVPVESMAQAVTVVGCAVAAAGEDADEHLRIDVRPDRVVATLQTFATGEVTARDAWLAREISAAVRTLDLRTEPGMGVGGRSVQVLEIAIDAMDIPAVRPFWRAVLGYVDEAGRSGPLDALVDPAGQGPAIWFQQMREPRPQRNRVHLDISVPHDEAAGRIQAALDAGGRLAYDEAPAFWVLCDPEGNEACVTTWQGRD